MRRLIVLLSMMMLLTSCNSYKGDAKLIESLTSVFSIPVNGNSWYLGNSNVEISTDSDYLTLGTDTLRTFFSIKQNCDAFLAIVAKCETEEAFIDAIYGDSKITIRVSSSSFDTLIIGKFTMNRFGYHYLDIVNSKQLEGIQISNIIIGGEFEKTNVNYVKDEYYWGKRGPSVHLTFSTEEPIDQIEWFYNEITVPEDNDVIGSYFMAIGFGEGYFGIQVNSEEERRVLFSVWSPFQTDHPEDIPEDQRIIMLKKGERVTAGNFGGEGSGGQSFMNYIWEAGITYQFLLKGEPTTNNCTDYTAYFFSPKENKWMLIASFRRPQTNTYLTRFHSFLENFIPEQGIYPRMGIYSNQWVCNRDGIWFEANKARFTADNTARKGSRLDYSGGIIDGQFFMKNCGFFNDTITIGSEFIRPKAHKKPEINFDELP